MSPTYPGDGGLLQAHYYYLSFVTGLLNPIKLESCRKILSLVNAF